jgi:hypothetical protein
MIQFQVVNYRALYLIGFIQLRELHRYLILKKTQVRRS